MMKLDLHVHTCYSDDGSAEPKDYLKIAKKNGLDGFAITDHNEVAGAKKTYELAEGFRDLLVIRGIEVSTSEGHVLGYGVTEKIPRGLTPKETVEKITDAGGVAVAAHPFRRASGLGLDVVKRVNFNSVEILNHRSTQRENERASKLASNLNTGTTGGSDAHFVKELGLAATKFKIECENKDEVIDLIVKKQTTPVGTSSTTIEGLKMYTKLMTFWLKRGFKRV